MLFGTSGINLVTKTLNLKLRSNPPPTQKELKFTFNKDSKILSLPYFGKQIEGDPMFAHKLH